MEHDLKFKSITDENIKNSLESLPLTVSRASLNTNALSDTIILHINHSFKDVFAFNELLTKTLGAELYYISIPYNNIRAPKRDYFYLESLRNGISFITYHEGKILKDLAKHEDLVELVKTQIDYTMKKILPKLQNKKLLIVQDGGYTATVDGLTRKNDFFGSIPQLIGMVEQTQSGTELFRLREKIVPLKYPIVTISRSLIKVRLESEFISQRIFEELNELFYKMGDFLRFKTVIVGGYGVVGRKVASYLRSIQIEVLVYDIDPIIRRLARKEGFVTLNNLDKESVEESYCYIGITGKKSFTISGLKAFMESEKTQYALASGSSKRIEFLDIIRLFEGDINNAERKELIKKHLFLRDIKNIRVITTEYGFRYEFIYKNKSKCLLMLAGGFPVNMFDPDSESVPDRAIDIIQSLMLESILQIKKCKTLTKGINYIGRNGFNEIIGLDEHDLVREWCSINNINLIEEDPFTMFLPHPLEKYLIEKQYDKN